MISLMTRSLIMFLSCDVIAQCRAEDLPIRLVDYSILYNGNFDNIDQIKDDLHDKIQIKVKPALLPALQKEPVIYQEEAVNGNIYRRSVIVRNESSTDRILYLNYYNFTDPSQHDLRTFSADDVSNLTRQDFRIDEGCHASFVQLSPGVIFGQVLDCRHAFNGKHPIYSVYLTCDNLRFEPPLAADETTSLLSYDLKNKGPRYPMIDLPEGYGNPCQDGL